MAKVAKTLSLDEIKAMLDAANRGETVSVEISTPSAYRKVSEEPVDAKDRREAWSKRLARRIHQLRLAKEGNYVGDDGKLVNGQGRGGKVEGFREKVANRISQIRSFFSDHCDDVRTVNTWAMQVSHVVEAFNNAIDAKLAKLTEAKSKIDSWTGVGDFPACGFTWNDLVPSASDTENEARENVAAESAS